MNKIAQFHKVSFEQFKESWDDSFPGASEEEIKEISIGQKVRQKFETSLEDVSDSKLKTIADFDKKYHLQTKEIILVKTGWFGYYNLIQKDGTNLVLDLFLSDLYYGSRSTKDLKKIYLFHKFFDKIKNNEIWSIKLLRLRIKDAFFIAFDSTIYFYIGSW